MHNNRKKIELKFSNQKNLQKQWAVFTIRNEEHHAFQWKSDKTLIISYMETNLTLELSKSLTFFPGCDVSYKIANICNIIH